MFRALICVSQVAFNSKYIGLMHSISCFFQIKGSFTHSISKDSFLIL